MIRDVQGRIIFSSFFFFHINLLGVSRKRSLRVIYLFLCMHIQISLKARSIFSFILSGYNEVLFIFFIDNTMKKQYEVDEYLVRSGTRIRESVRCLPRGHFQQIRQMFDKQNCDRSTKPKVRSSHILRELPVTDDEKLQHQTNMNDIILEDDKSFQVNLSNSNENHFHTGKLLFSKNKTKCNHLIECQRPVLSLFIKHQGSIIKQKNK